VLLVSTLSLSCLELSILLAPTPIALTAPQTALGLCQSSPSILLTPLLVSRLCSLSYNNKSASPCQAAEHRPHSHWGGSRPQTVDTLIQPAGFDSLEVLIQRASETMA
jgi:hypothetical protein